jgi:hypothetical protein
MLPSKRPLELGERGEGGGPATRQLMSAPQSGLCIQSVSTLIPGPGFRVERRYGSLAGGSTVWQLRAQTLEAESIGSNPSSDTSITTSCVTLREIISFLGTSSLTYKMRPITLLPMSLHTEK